MDVLLVHDAPAGVIFELHRRGAGRASEAAGLDDLVRSVRPRVCFFGHYHIRADAAIDGIPCMGLNESPHPGSLVAVEIGERFRGMKVIAEWPRATDR